MSDKNNGTFKKTVGIITLAILSWFAVDYINLRTRATVLETNYLHISATLEKQSLLLEKIDKKVDRLDPDYGPATR